MKIYSCTDNNYSQNFKRVSIFKPSPRKISESGLQELKLPSQFFAQLCVKVSKFMRKTREAAYKTLFQ